MADNGGAYGRARGRARGPAIGAGGPPGFDAENARPPAGAAAAPRGGLAARGAAGGVDAAARLDRIRERRQRLLDALITPRTRPENVTTVQGESGQPVQLVSNFFRVQGGPTWSVFEYHVDFEPEVDFLSVRRALVAQHKDKIGERFSFNGANLIAAKKLPDGENVWHSKRDSDDAVINLRVRLTGEVSPDSDEAIRVLSIAIKEMQRALNLQQSRDSFFDPAAAIAVPNQPLTVWPGYDMTIAKYDRELLLNMDITHRVLRTDTVYDYMKAVVSRERENGRAVIERELTGAVVVTQYNNKTYTIDDILWPPENTVGTTTFRDAQGNEKSIAQYMREHYSIEIKDLKQPMLVSRARKMNRRVREGEEGLIKLIPELCYMSGLSDAQRSDFTLMRAYADITRLDPRARMGRYMAFGQRVAASKEATEKLSHWGLKLAAEPLKIQGRQMASCELQAAGGQKIMPSRETADWSNEIKNMKALDNAGGLVEWALIYPNRDEPAAREFDDCMRRVGRGMGITVGTPKILPIENIRADTYKQACTQALKMNPNCKMVIALLPRKDRAPYEVIKKTTLIDCGVPSQVVVLNTLRKGTMSVCTKVMQQVCVKLGGALWKVSIPLKRTMICGFDTYHDSSARGKSVGGFVATIDAEYTKFYSRSFQHESRAEISHHLVPCMAEALKVYSDRNGSLPDIILFYRDGVADNQLRAVHDAEVEQLRNVALQFGSDYQPRMAVVVVQKRIRPRFFAVLQPGNQLKNPLPGTVVDNTVTNPRSYDFYVISQSVRQGTVTPTRYNVIYESTSLKPDHHHQLAFRLSHLYYNWPGTIRVVAPCHYAHKLAYLIGQHVHSEVHARLRTSLYYL